MTERKNAATAATTATVSARPLALRVVPLDQWVARTRRLLELERGEEVAAVQDELAQLRDAENPNVLVRAALRSCTTALFGRTLCTFVLPLGHMQRPRPHQFTVGDLVQIRVDATASATSGDHPTGIVSRVGETEIAIALDDRADVDEDQLRAQGGVTIDRLVNNATFAKIGAALDQLAKFDHAHAQSVVDIVFSGRAPAWNPLPAITSFNSGLNESQLDAIRFALASKDLALIHGPPGTGKTTTVVELILQAVKTFKMKVLVCAPSNIAVDTVLEKMATVDATLQLTRIGHPARLLPQILRHCLDARIQQADGTEIVRDVRKEMAQLETQLKKTRDKGVRFQIRRDLKANRKEIRQREQKVVGELLKHSDVVFATNVGAASKLLKDITFDLVVIDEAAQALEASCWIPILKAKRCVLAGDHLQLPPTIKSRAAAAGGLETTLFDRVTRFETTKSVVKMLKIQYRMHEHISNWSSRAMYDGELQSFEGVAKRKLHELAHVNIAPDDELLNATLLLLDTAGCDLEEDIADESEGDNARGATQTSLLKLSKSNAGEARVVEKHVRALLRAGLKTEEMAIITPYNKQVQLLKALLLDEFPTLEIRSVDGFQGCEKEAVVMSLVRSNAAHEVGFLADDRRMNVAITRAKRHVAVVCDTDTISAHAFLKQLVAHFEDFGEYRSAQDYLDEDLIHGVGVVSDAYREPLLPASVSKAEIALGKQQKNEPNAPRPLATSTKPIDAKKPGQGANAQRAPVSISSGMSKQESNAAAKAKNKAGGSNDATTTVTAIKVSTHPETSREGDDVGIKPATVDDLDGDDDTPQPEQKSAFLLLNDSSSSESSEDERENAQPDIPVVSADTTNANALLKELYLSRLARQPPPAPTQSLTGGKKGKKKKGKKKSPTVGNAVAVDEFKEDEDELAFLTRQAEQSNRCCFKNASQLRCKKTVTMMGAVCRFCKLKFCYDHAQAEVHGCADAVRQFERQQFQARAAKAQPSDTKKLTIEKRKLLQKKLEGKVSEQAASRTTKAKGKKDK